MFLLLSNGREQKHLQETKTSLVAAIQHFCAQLVCKSKASSGDDTGGWWDIVALGNAQTVSVGSWGRASRPGAGAMKRQPGGSPPCSLQDKTNLKTECFEAAYKQKSCLRSLNSTNQTSRWVTNMFRDKNSWGFFFFLVFSMFLFVFPIKQIISWKTTCGIGVFFSWNANSCSHGAVSISTDAILKAHIRRNREPVKMDVVLLLVLAASGK